MKLGERETVKKKLRERGWVRGVVGVVGVIVVIFGGVWGAFHNALPKTKRDGADALARRMLTAVDAVAWEHTGAIRWVAPGGGRHLWDRVRGFHRYERSGVRVLLDLGRRDGVAFRDGHLIEGDERRRAITDAYAVFCNDSFWLNPVVKVFDPGTVRAVAQGVNGHDELLVTYTSGGVTPGDRYLWLLGENARPRAWRMWVKIIPVGGVEATWEGWQRLSTGAWVSTVHRLGPITLSVREVTAAKTLGELVQGSDPFGELARWRGG